MRISNFVFNSLMTRHNYKVDLNPNFIKIRKGNKVKSNVLPFKIGGATLTLLGLLCIYFGALKPGFVILFTSIPVMIRAFSSLKSEKDGIISLLIFKDKITVDSDLNNKKDVVDSSWYNMINAEVVPDKDLNTGIIYLRTGTDQIMPILKFFGDSEKVLLDDLDVVLKYLYQFKYE